jgi:hypothetical protein
MAKKKDMVKLFAPNMSKYEEFEFGHAEAILQDAERRLNKNPKKVTWTLPENSEYDFVNGKLITGTDTGKNTKAAKKE